jgi:glucokinase
MTASGSPEQLFLVGDVGATNCRLAVVTRAAGAGGQPSRVRIYPDDDYPTFEGAVAAYLRDEGVTLAGAVIAIAGPVADGEVAMSNRAWRISERQLAATLGGDARCRLINDFEALAYALPALGAADLRPLGSPRPAPARGTLAVLGAGTGLGVAALVRDGVREAVLVGEGGHAAFAPQTDLESEVARRLAAGPSRYLAVEHLLSGPGLVRLHAALCEISGRAPAFAEPVEITTAAAAGDARALEVADLFVRVLGGVAGDIALAFGARGGVYVAGGVSQRLLQAGSAQAAFRVRFEAKGAFAGYVAAIPTFLITHPLPGLLGAALALQHLLA